VPRNRPRYINEYSQPYTFEGEREWTAIVRRWEVEGKCTRGRTRVTDVAGPMRQGPSRHAQQCEKSNTCSRPTNAGTSRISVTHPIGCRFSYTLPSLESSRPRRAPPGRRMPEPQQHNNTNHNNSQTTTESTQATTVSPSHSQPTRPGTHTSLAANRRLSPSAMPSVKATSHQVVDAATTCDEPSIASTERRSATRHPQHESEVPQSPRIRTRQRPVIELSGATEAHRSRS